MARSINPQEYALKRNEILDVAQKLVYTKGYEQMTIQDLLDALHISKGAFYHYFSSKPTLLEALLQRILEQAEQVLVPVVQDTDLSALEKLQRFFATASNWKVARKDYLMALMQGWYSDDNALVRQKMLALGLERLARWYTVIIHQGITEGVFAPPFPDQVGEVVLSLVQNLGDTLAGFFLSGDPKRKDLPRAEGIVAVYTDALERVLRASPGSLHLIDSEMLKEWFVG